MECAYPSSCRYEDEISKRTAAENEFLTLKKVSWLITEMGFSAKGQKWPCMSGSFQRNGGVETEMNGLGKRVNLMQCC
jgi:hypothetical protein